MKTLLIYAIPIATVLTSLSQAATVIVFAEDFDGTTIGGGVTINNNINPTSAIVADPDAAQTDMVFAVDMSGGTQWGAFNPGTPPNNIVLSTIPVPAGQTIIPGVSTVTYTYDIFVPNDTTAADNDDTTGAIIRRNGINTGNISSGTTRLVAGGGTILPRGVWQTVSASATIPLLDGTGAPLTSLQPILSFRDGGTDAAAGIFAYVDNIQFSIETVPEPSRAMLVGLGALTLLARRRR